MFEKEAKEYGDNYVKSKYMETVDETWRKGAEFGYNKANEWHFPKDGDLPKEENLECLCIIRPIKEEGEPFKNNDFRGVLYYRNKRFYLDENDSNDCLLESNSDFTDLVIAWKEIVLPELKESE